MKNTESAISECSRLNRQLIDVMRENSELRDRAEQLTNANKVLFDLIHAKNEETQNE